MYTRRKWLGGQANSGLTAPGSVYGQLLKRAKVLLKQKKRSFVFNIFSLSGKDLGRKRPLNQIIRLLAEKAADVEEEWSCYGVTVEVARIKGLNMALNGKKVRFLPFAGKVPGV